MPKISIITPVYIDTEEKISWLDEMIQSVISQSVTDWELILIDDKSPVSFNELKQKYNDPRLRWLENAQNYGPAMTRNTAVAMAESECILPLDSDDMLGTNETLEAMYDAWSIDQTKTIYGNIQLYKVGANGFERSKVHQLAQYSIEGAMHLEFGIMPVTTMHSKQCHESTLYEYEPGKFKYGWKPELSHGREDLEYWIAAGKAGYCGQKINHTTLLYRKHEGSRDYKLKFENQQLRAMQEKIKSMHSDIYQGRFPMGCCGKSSTADLPNDPLLVSQQSQGATRVTELQGDYEDKDLEWIAYNGPKKGRFDILARGAQGLPSSYTILGTGHVFQIHKQHKKIFSDRQRLGFAINQSDPRQQIEPEPVPLPEPVPQVISVSKPELATLLRADKATAEIIIEPNPAQFVSSVISDLPAQMPSDYMTNNVKDALHVNNLGLSPELSDTLDNAGYTVEKLAVTSPEQLAELRGIGIKRGETIINRAKELIKRT